jgi:hypothetical protein
MSLQWPAPDYVDGDFTTAQPVGIPVFSSPLPNTTAQLTFKQDFMQFLASVAPLLLNTSHPSAGKTPDYSSYYLVSEGEKQDVGGGVVKWTRTYSVVPTSWEDTESYVYKFPGTAPMGALSSSAWGRKPFALRVTSRVVNDYFLCGPGMTYTYPKDIPIIEAFQVVSQFVLTATQFGGWNYSQESVSDRNYTGLDTTSAGDLFISLPSATQYAAMLHDSTKNGWNAGVTRIKLTDTDIVLVDIAGMVTYPTAYPTGDTTAYYGQLVAENSILARWQGNIWNRKTRHVLAQ